MGLIQLQPCSKGFPTIFLGDGPKASVPLSGFQRRQACHCNALTGVSSQELLEGGDDLKFITGSWHSKHWKLENFANVDELDHCYRSMDGSLSEFVGFTNSK